MLKGYYDLSKQNLSMEVLCQRKFYANGSAVSREVPCQRKFYANGSAVSREVPCQRKFHANGSSMPTEVLCQRKFCVNGSAVATEVLWQQKLCRKESAYGLWEWLYPTEVSKTMVFMAWKCQKTRKLIKGLILPRVIFFKDGACRS